MFAGPQALGKALAPGDELRALVEDHHHDQYHRVDQHAVIVQAAQHLGQNGQQRRRNDRPAHAAHAAQNHKHQDLDRGVVIKTARRQRGKVQPVQHPGQPGEHGRDHKGQQLVVGQVDADALRGDLIVADGRDRAPGAGADQVEHDRDGGQHQQGADRKVGHALDAGDAHCAVDQRHAVRL